ncbi:MAG: ring,2-phenylacetyl-CoA epoxidase subunit PaaC [Actinomycetota bacterium]|nr:ring,2-phenylacetyl-CoA epoxidase subunit PaaC [Actinomycetota bacterium]
MSRALATLVTALADDELVLGHRHSEWTGYAPHIEEDVAFSSIAQDEVGHAAALYALAGKILGDEPDHLAFGRQADEYRNALLCERPNGDWAYTLARHWVYDTADDVRLESMEGSSNEELAALTTKMRREERYHLIHAEMWLKRIARGPIEGRNKLIHALEEVLLDSSGLFEPLPEEDTALTEGWVTASSQELAARFLARTNAWLDEVGIPIGPHSIAGERAEFVASSSGDLIEEAGPSLDEAHTSKGGGGRSGRHSPDFTELWDVMTKTYREHPGARW